MDLDLDHFFNLEQLISVRFTVEHGHSEYGTYDDCKPNRYQLFKVEKVVQIEVHIHKSYHSAQEKTRLLYQKTAISGSSSG